MITPVDVPEMGLKWLVSQLSGHYSVSGIVYPDFVYMWPDGHWRRMAFFNMTEHAYYESKDEAEKVFSGISRIKTPENWRKIDLEYSMDDEEQYRYYL